VTAPVRPNTEFTFDADVLQVAQPIAPAALMVIGDVPLNPALPTEPMGIAAGILATGSVPEEILEALVASVVAEVASPFDPAASVPIMAVVTVAQVGAASAFSAVTT